MAVDQPTQVILYRHTLHLGGRSPLPRDYQPNSFSNLFWAVFASRGRRKMNILKTPSKMKMRKTLGVTFGSRNEDAQKGSLRGGFWGRLL